MGLSFKSANGPRPKITFIREKQGSDSLICEQLSCFHVVVGRDLLKVVNMHEHPRMVCETSLKTQFPYFQQSILHP